MCSSDLEIDRRQRETERLSRGSLREGGSAPALLEDELTDVGPQSIMAMKQRHKWIDFYGESRMYYTDNMFFQENLPGSRAKATSVFQNTVQLTLTPPSWKLGKSAIKPRAGFRHLWYNYALIDGAPGTKSSFDFDSQTFFAEFNYGVGDWLFQAGFDYMRLMSHAPTVRNYSEFYDDYVQIGRAHV